MTEGSLRPMTCTNKRGAQVTQAERPTTQLTCVTSTLPNVSVGWKTKDL